MPAITIGTPFNIDLEFRIAPFGKRFSAWLIDIVIISIYFYVMLRFIYPLLNKGDAIATGAILFVVIIPVLLYQLIFELFLNGQTIGKKLMGIAVIDMEGKEPGWSQYILRWVLCIGNLFVYVIPYMIITSPAALLFFLVLYLPDFLSVVISAKSQRLGDFAAGTVVIDKRYRANINETIYLDIEKKEYHPLFPQVMRLTDRDINGIRNLLDAKRQGKGNEAYMLQVVEKIKTVLTIETELQPRDFLEQLLRDYNYYTATQNA